MRHPNGPMRLAGFPRFGPPDFMRPGNYWEADHPANGQAFDFCDQELPVAQGRPRTVPGLPRFPPRAPMPPRMLRPPGPHFLDPSFRGPNRFGRPMAPPRGPPMMHSGDIGLRSPPMMMQPRFPRPPFMPHVAPRMRPPFPGHSPRMPMPPNSNFDGPSFPPTSSYGYFEYDYDDDDDCELQENFSQDYDEEPEEDEGEFYDAGFGGFEADEAQPKPCGEPDFSMDSVNCFERPAVMKSRLIAKPPLLGKRPALLSRGAPPHQAISAVTETKGAPRPKSLNVDGPVDISHWDIYRALSAREFYKTFQRFMFDYDPKFTWDDDSDAQKNLKNKKHESLYRELKLLKNPANPHESIMLGGHYWEWSDEYKWSQLQRRLKQENGFAKESMAGSGRLFDDEQLEPVIDNARYMNPQDKLVAVLLDDIGFPEGCCGSDYCGVCDENLSYLSYALRHYVSEEHGAAVHEWFAKRLLSRRYLTHADVRKEWVQNAIRSAVKKIRPVPESWECYACAATLRSEAAAYAHIQTKSHEKLQNEFAKTDPRLIRAKRKKAAAKLAAAPPPPQKKQKVQHHCDACNVTLPSEKAYNSHCLTLQHTRAETQHAIFTMQGISGDEQLARDSESPPPPPPPRIPARAKPQQLQRQEQLATTNTTCAVGSPGCHNGTCTGCTFAQLKQLEEAKRRAVLLLTGYGQ